MSDHKGLMSIDTDLVRQLAELLDTGRLTEIEVEDGERRIRVARKPASQAAAPAPVAVAAAAPATSIEITGPVADQPGLIRSPMVGTAYLASEPGARAFAAVGDRVEEGQTLLIIEAMKVMNSIPSPRSGTVRQIVVANGQPVEFDQPLLIVE